jgi:hypothetical protein
MNLVKSEYIGDIVSSATPGAFSLFSYTVNPGLFNLFPYGATIANSFAQYQFVRLAFRYVPTSGTSTGNADPALGTVAARFLYDPTESVDDSYFMMQSQHGAHTSVTSMPFTYKCGVGSAASRVQKVRVGSVPTGQDPRMFDLGIFEIATNGVPSASSNLGQLFVDYEVRLMKPVLVGGFRGATALFGHWSGAVDYTNTAPLGVATQMSSVSDQNTITPYIPTYVSTGAGPIDRTIYLPVTPIKYRVMLVISWVGTGTFGVVFPSTALSSGVSVLTAFDTPSAPTPYDTNPGTGEICSHASLSYMLEVAPTPGSPPYLQLGTGGTLPSGTRSAEVIMCVVPYNAY